MSMTNALISVESAVAISLAMRRRLCDAQRLTYSARTIDAPRCRAGARCLRGRSRRGTAPAA